MTAVCMFPPEDQNNYKVYGIVKHIQIPEVEAENKTRDFPTQSIKAQPSQFICFPSVPSDFAQVSRQYSLNTHSSEMEQSWVLALPGSLARCAQQRHGDMEGDQMQKMSVRKHWKERRCCCSQDVFFFFSFCSLWHCFHTFNGEAARFKEAFPFKCAFTE